MYSYIIVQCTIACRLVETFNRQDLFQTKGFDRYWYPSSVSFCLKKYDPTMFWRKQCTCPNSYISLLSFISVLWISYRFSLKITILIINTERQYEMTLVTHQDYFQRRALLCFDVYWFKVRIVLNWGFRNISSQVQEVNKC